MNNYPAISRPYRQAAELQRRLEVVMDFLGWDYELEAIDEEGDRSIRRVHVARAAFQRVRNAANFWVDIAPRRELRSRAATLRADRAKARSRSMTYLLMTERSISDVTVANLAMLRPYRSLAFNDEIVSLLLDDELPLGSAQTLGLLVRRLEAKGFSADEAVRNIKYLASWRVLRTDHTIPLGSGSMLVRPALVFHRATEAAPWIECTRLEL